ncbi:MAG: hypothetical protein COA58_14685 [Bacteroidetes bacterium]|nr:MAG: hypothetical protein COA58_14685 [Bacteroidota bacterium]
MSESEKIRYSTIQFNSYGDKVTEILFAKNSDTIEILKYYYNTQNNLDSLIRVKQDNHLKEEYTYGSDGKLVSIDEIYNHMRSRKERHSYKDSVHASVKHYMGNMPSSRSELEFNNQGSLIKRVILSPEGNFWGQIEYLYTDFGKLSVETHFNKRGIANEIREFRYNSNQLLEWKIVKNLDGKLFTKLQYTYE